VTAGSSREHPLSPDPAALAGDEFTSSRRDPAAARAALRRQWAAEAQHRGISVEEVRSEYYRRVAGAAGHTRRIQNIERRIREMRETAPPLTPSQLARLRAILAELVTETGSGAA
jgi:hypothetical protein